MSKTLSHSIQDPFDTTVFDRTTQWARYAVMVRVLPGDDYEYTGTLNALREATPTSFRRFWQLHLRGGSPDNSSVISMFTWLGPQRLIAIIRLADSHSVIKQVMRVDNSEDWHRIGECTDRRERNYAEIRRLRNANHGSVEQGKLAHRAAEQLDRDIHKLEKEIQKLYTRLIA